MRRLRRKDGGKELSALARLSDGDIDTSDIPEIKDWSRAIIGRFYKSVEQRRFPLPLNTKTVANDLLVELGSTHIHSTATTGVGEVSNIEIVKACASGLPEAWQEFIRRFNRLLATVVMQTSRRWGVQPPEQLDDLVAEVYFRLCADDYRLLKMYQGRHENSFFGYLKVIATNVVHDHFRRAGSHMLAIDTAVEAIYELNAPLVGSPDDTASPQEREIFLEEIDRILKATASENERAIFWLYYREGFSAAEIAAVLTSNLTVKGVEGLLHRVTSRIRSELTKQNPKLPRP